MNIIEIISIIISFLALVVSIFTIRSNRKYDFNLKVYYEPFNDILINILPSACNRLYNTNQNIVYREYCEDFSSVILLFNSKLNFVQFINREKYNIVQKLLIKLDDIACRMCDSPNGNIYINEMNNTMSDLYLHFQNIFVLSTKSLFKKNK